AWLGLAGVAETLEERRHAVARVLELDPQHPLARRWMQQFYEQAPPLAHQTPVPPVRILPQPPVAPREPEPSATAPATLTPVVDDARPPTHRVPAWAFALVAILLFVIAFWGIRAALSSTFFVGVAPPPTPTLPGQLLPLLPDATTNPVGAPPVMLPGTEFVPPERTLVLNQPTPTRAPNEFVSPTELAMGAFIEYDNWQASLLKPNYALVLDGAIGDREPAGRFVLALLAIGNNAATPRFIPPDLFVLVDDQGRSYRPETGVSSMYLNLYGRGQRGELALEDAIEPAGRVLSVPLLFDVPQDATGLFLIMGRQPIAGWPVLERVQDGALPLTATPNAGP
ncbi:MAG: hypothetical protein MI924_02595, partial [Chloroflexales bacterium]|nr:hypothetical protein [Chloroflexales bacterium]